jgi:hypothetical protein
MSYTATIQIQPFPNKKRLDTKRESLYTCIRYASNLMKFKTDIRKHNRTIPNDDLLQFAPPLPPHYTYNEKSSHYYYDQEEQQEETMTLYDEKEQDLTTKDCYHSRRESQLALPSRTRYTPINIIHQLDNNEDEEEEEDEYDDDEEFDEEEEEEEEEDDKGGGGGERPWQHGEKVREGSLLPT